MSTCGPGQRSGKGTLELFFITTAIKACYGRLPKLTDVEEADDGHEAIGRKRPRLESDKQSELTRRPSELQRVYTRTYLELRNKALSDIRVLVRERVERLSTPGDSYDFMNIYGMCCFAPPNINKPPAHENPTCKFTRVRDVLDDRTGLVTVCGILSAVVSARAQQGELALTPCQEEDYHRAVEEHAKLQPRSKRVAKLAGADLGSTISSMENRFIFTVRRDLHALGCAYRTVVLMVELLHMNILHFLHS